MAIQVKTVRHAGLVVPDAEDAVDFYEQVWGLRLVDDKDGAAYLRGTSSEHHLLAVYPGEGAGVHHVSLSLDNQAAVDAAAETLRAEGIPLVEEPHAINEPGGGYGLRFRDPDGRLIELSAEAEQAPTTEWKAPHVSLNHIAYEVPTNADIARGIEHFARRGQHPIWGPGRHGPGNNLFAYFRDPAGM